MKQTIVPIIMSVADTKNKILDAAEKLFALNGFDAASVRAIASDAGVNLAAINYHFRSKEALLHAVYERRVGPVNRRRLELLDQAEAEAAGKPVPIEKIVEAFAKPVIDLGEDVGHVPRMMLRLQYVDKGALLEKVFETHFRPTFLRMFAALRRSAPHLTEDETFWRMQFVIGAFAHMMAGTVSARMRGRKKTDRSQLLGQLVTFAAAGFRAESVEG